MKSQNPNLLANTLHKFFCDHLPNVRGASSHTVKSYRDSIKLLLLFISKNHRKPVSSFDIENITSDEITTFLQDSETNRCNTVGTRNIRLSAIHSFFRYFGAMNPQYLDLSQRVLNVPFKRTSTRVIEYLEFNEIASVLEAIDRATLFGKRDYALLTLMFNTGARVQEIVDLRTSDLCLSGAYSITIWGKGRKQRVCPLWPQTAKILRAYLEERGVDPRSTVPLFTNCQNVHLTRFGVRYILSKYLKKAAIRQPSISKKRLHPHSVRHSTAVHLLKSGVDLATISLWLGHSNVNTTNKYAVMDVEMKRKVLEQTKPFGQIRKNTSSWKKPDVLAWLESL